MAAAGVASDEAQSQGTLLGDVYFAPYGNDVTDLGDRSLILRNLTAIGRVKERDREEVRKMVGAALTRALQASAFATAARNEVRSGSVAILGATSTGAAVAEALLAAQWPARLIEIAAVGNDDETPTHLVERGIAFSTRLGGPIRRAAIIVVCSQSSRVQTLAKYMRKFSRRKLVISCVVGVQTSKQRVSFGCSHLIRTRVENPTAVTRVADLESAIRQAAATIEEANHILASIRGFVDGYSDVTTHNHWLPAGVTDLPEFTRLLLSRAQLRPDCYSHETEQTSDCQSDHDDGTLCPSPSHIQDLPHEVPVRASES